MNVCVYVLKMYIKTNITIASEYNLSCWFSSSCFVCVKSDSNFMFWCSALTNSLFILLSRCSKSDTLVANSVTF